MRACVALVAALAACRGRATRDVTPEPVEPTPTPAVDAGPTVDAFAPWPALAGLPRAEPTHVVTLPTQPKNPRFEVAGPVIAGDVAVVASSQFGFHAVAWRTGALAWSKPAGLRVAPPVVIGSSIDLIGECPQTGVPEVPPGDALLGCLRSVTFAGTDLAFIAIHGKVPAFAAEPGTSTTWADDDHTIRWRRGEHAVAIDTVTGVARVAAVAPPPLRVTHRDRAWDVTRTDAAIVATPATPRTPRWATQHPYSQLVGAVYLPDQSPMVRVLSIGPFGGIAEINVLDIDATGSLHGQAAFPVPGIAALATATSSIGDTAIAVRLDASLQHDYIAGYAANALLMYVYPLPVIPRADPIGVALAPEAVVVFHDGDTVTILPELSAPPTAPGAARAPSRIPTP